MKGGGEKSVKVLVYQDVLIEFVFELVGDTIANVDDALSASTSHTPLVAVIPASPALRAWRWERRRLSSSLAALSSRSGSISTRSSGRAAWEEEV